MTERRNPGYRWFAAGDISGFFGLISDNMAVLAFMAGILIFAFDFPAEVVYRRMIPGTALGVLFGDLVYTWLAFRLAKKTGSEVTAMPLGLDAPSTIGIALAVLGPAFAAFKRDGYSPPDAAHLTWCLGMATMVMIGVFKVVASLCGDWVRRIVPTAGLLGSLAGIGLLLIGFMPLVNIFGLPVVGLIALGIILYTLVARLELPGKIPGVFTAVLIGTLLYHLLGPSGLLGVAYQPPSLDLQFGFPLPRLGFVRGLVPALRYLPIALPFAILTVIGGINVTASARLAGDDYGTRSILLTDALATLAAGVCGGVAQSTPYIGQPAYKRMGARAGYTLLTGLFIGLGGIFGFLSFFINLIPAAVLAPILVFVALDIVTQAFASSPGRHAPAVVLAIFPTVARLLSIKFEDSALIPAEHLQKLISETGSTLPEVLVTLAVGNGFILTGLLWGGFLAVLIDRKLKVGALYLLVTAGLTFFGVIHSATVDGRIYLPWKLEAFARAVPYQFAIGYLAMAGLLLLLSLTRGGRNPLAGEGGDEP